MISELIGFCGAHPIAAVLISLSLFLKILAVILGAVFGHVITDHPWMQFIPNDEYDSAINE